MKLLLLFLAVGIACFGQAADKKASADAKKDEKSAQADSGKTAAPAEPPEEDEQDAPKTYSFNPLQAQKEVEVGNFDLKRGAYKGAISRYEVALKYNPTYAEAYYRLGTVYEKIKDEKSAREAFGKYLEMEPTGKHAAEAKKKVGK